ncbi:MAG TPA: outer membrane beta-barrel protein, partial [Gemmatimonadales bacterium]|nr:outer membrane beta-barrel protein [Gemmatimonadales bacterium]
MKRTRIAMVVVSALLLGSGAAQAQVYGLPVFNSGVSSGLGIMGDVGFPNDDSDLKTTYGATATIGIGLLGFSASVARSGIESSDRDFTSVGGTANFKVLGGPLIPLAATLQAGVAFAEVEDGENHLRVPIGLGLTLTIPSVAVAIKPWLAPRLEIVRMYGDTVQDDTDTRFGLSGGIDFNLINGLGFRAAADYVNVDGGSPTVFSVGAGYNFRLPG